MLSADSKIVKKLLGFYFFHEDENFYLNEIVRRLGIDKRNLVKKLRELDQEGILVSEIRGNQRYFSLNKNYPLYKEYRNIFRKTFGLGEKLKKVLTGIKGIKNVYIYGSYASDNMDVHSDIDIIVIGNQDTIKVHDKITGLQKSIGREINVINISQKEFERKTKQKDPFIASILQGKNIKII